MRLALLGIVALLMKFYSLLSNSWSVRSGLTMGLWKSCDDDGECLSVPFEGDSGKNFPKTPLLVSRILAVMGSIVAITALILMLFWKKIEIYKLLFLVAGVLILSTSVFWYLKMLKLKDSTGQTIKFKAGNALLLNFISGVFYLFISIMFILKNP